MKNRIKRIMSTAINFVKLLKLRQLKQIALFQPSQCLQYYRGFADKPISDTTSKQIAIQGPDKEEQFRVRRARPADVPRVLRFVRDNARVAWPDFINPHPNFHLVLGDYVARALSQGHSMLAEQQEAKRGWNQIRGLAISTLVCPWDAKILENWARCVRCKRSRQFVHFTAHCLQAPALHDKYQVHKILQVILIVPPDVPKATEVIHMLAKNTVKRGREVGLPVLRFDVNSETTAKVLDQLNLTKEWELSYNKLPDAFNGRNYNSIKEDLKNMETGTNTDDMSKLKQERSFIAVYTSTNYAKK